MIELTAVRERDETRRMAYFMVDEYAFSAGNVPVEMDTDTKVLNWLKKNEDFYMFLILQKMYRDGEVWADWSRFKTNKNTNLQAFQGWISKGCKNKIQIGLTKAGKPKYGYRIIEKLPWRPTHPKEVKHAAELEAADTVEKLKKVVKKVIMT